MNALERVHRSLVSEGLLLDMHPTPPAARAVGPPDELGVFDEEEFFAIVRATEAGLQTLVARGLFIPERELAFESRERFDTSAELLETVRDWQGFRVPRALERRLRAADGPVEIREAVILRRFRAVG